MRLHPPPQEPHSGLSTRREERSLMPLSLSSPIMRSRSASPRSAKCGMFSTEHRTKDTSPHRSLGPARTEPIRLAEQRRTRPTSLTKLSATTPNAEPHAEEPPCNRADTHVVSGVSRAPASTPRGCAMQGGSGTCAWLSDPPAARPQRDLPHLRWSAACPSLPASVGGVCCQTAPRSACGPTHTQAAIVGSWFGAGHSSRTAGAEPPQCQTRGCYARHHRAHPDRLAHALDKPGRRVRVSAAVHRAAVHRVAVAVEAVEAVEDEHAGAVRDLRLWVGRETKSRPERWNAQVPGPLLRALPWCWLLWLLCERGSWRAGSAQRRRCRLPPRSIPGR